MEYITLPDLTNPYPQPGNYIKTGNDDVTLFGLYPETNTYLFTLEDLSQITPIEDTDFRFIVSFSNHEDDILDPVLYTSREYYDDLISSFEEGNPYFINYSFNDVFILKVYLDRFLNVFTPLAELESKYGIHIKKNIFINDNKEILYSDLVKYINWLVSPSELDEVDTDGVLPHYKLSTYTGGRFNTDTLQWGDESSVIKEMRIKDILDELKSVEDDIRDITEFLKNPDKVDFNKVSYAISRAVGPAGTAAIATATAVLGVAPVVSTILSVGAIALAPYALAVVAAGAIVVGVRNFIKGLFGASKEKKKAEDDLLKYLNSLRNELVRLHNRKNELLIELQSLETD